MSAKHPIRVMVVDDHRQIHEQVSDILRAADDIDLVAHASNGHEAVHLCKEHLPDVVLMDVVMPESSGEEATLRLREVCPEAKILVLSSFKDDESVHAMLRNGASGYITKRDLATGLISAIRTTYTGQAVFSDEVVEQVLNPDQTDDDADRFGLSEREQEVLRLMAQGQNNNQIAYELVISRSTVNFHISNIVRKLGVETRAEALVLAARHHLV